MDNRRGVSPQCSTIPVNNSTGEGYPNLSRHPNSKVYQQEFFDDHDARYPEERTSEETVGNIEEMDANKNNYPNSPNEGVYEKAMPKHANAAFREKYQRFNDYLEGQMPETLSAMHRLQKLRELQLKRDMSERYYTQEIKRLIGDYYFGSRYSNMNQPLLKPNGRLQQSTSFQPYVGDRVKTVSKNLEACGTMTTITRLDCGCIQETTRPIFTTSKGRVQRKKCNQSQDEILLKITSSNPQEHLVSSLGQRKDGNCRPKSKKKSLIEPRMCAKIPPGGDQGFETENEKRNQQAEVEISGLVSRTPFPCRKFSDTSVISG